MSLTYAQHKALRELGPKPGHFLVNWRPDLSTADLVDLRKRGLIEEHWTWASTTRPDTGITRKGLAEMWARKPASEDTR